MCLIIIIFIVITTTLVDALPNVKQSKEQQPNTDSLTRQIANSIYAFTKKQPVTTPFNISGGIENMIERIIGNIPDPMSLDEIIVHEVLGDGTSVSVSTHKVTVSGQRSLYIDTLCVNLINPLRPRITYKFVLPELALYFDSLHANLNYNGMNLNIHITGQVAILNSSIGGMANVSTLTHRLTELTTIIQVGTIQSTLVGSMNNINITSLIASIVTDIIPQLLNEYANQINEYVADIIMKLI